MAAGPLSITCFRYRPRNLAGDDADLNRLNRSVLEAIQRDGRVFLTGTAARPAVLRCAPASSETFGPRKRTLTGSSKPFRARAGQLASNVQASATLGCGARS